MNLKTYFAVEGLINDRMHEGPLLPLLTSGSLNTFSHISSFIRVNIESRCLSHTVPQHTRIPKNYNFRLNSYLLTCFKCFFWMKMLSAVGTAESWQFFFSCTGKKQTNKQTHFLDLWPGLSVNVTAFHSEFSRNLGPSKTNCHCDFYWKVFHLCVCPSHLRYEVNVWKKL